MKKFLKLLTSISLTFSLVLLILGNSYASDNLVNDAMLNSSQVKITVTNNETGETTVLNPIETKNNMKVNSIRSNNESLTVGYDVFVPIEDPNSTGITPFDTAGGSKTSGGVTAKLYVDYDVSGNNEQVRLNRVYGSWTPSSSLYYLTNREVGAHSGFLTGKSMKKNPTSDTFSYTTGWGFNDRFWGDASPRAWSSAIARVHGMTATHTISVEFTYS
ncbi:hypothetical protein CLPU_3c01890 [Gottschalkia purinilytica]|uniref:Uncharacterized protein n=1 Tax=Gottschalkia purinilytica TaxID=1503 RepID=A0A0L0WD92_GOTPU|nr:hypothetical protein [Gottschalkia purinilytica]KNF09411.1 hypothetical protein CLPU_3c01890 [Gottschalkia purinilytica]